MSTTEDSPRGGPRPLDPEAVDRFLGQERWASMCAEDASGVLSAVPVRLIGGKSTDVAFLSADPEASAAVALDGRPVCLVADQFESYDGIEGVILRGRLHQRAGAKAVAGRGQPPVADEKEHFVLEVASGIGFTFAGTLPPELRADDEVEPSK
jgi:hypothetical protein